MEVRKFGTPVAVSDEVLAATADEIATWRRWSKATPEQRAQWALDAANGRAQRRATTPHVFLTVERLVEKMGWTHAYAEHLVQPYCECWHGPDGWDYCQHAEDEGLTP